MTDRAPLVAVLAAGRASRFGGGKLDTELGGKPLAQWVLDAVAAADLAPGVIVVPPVPPAFALAAQGWQLVANPGPEAGLGSSVALAAQVAEARRRDLLLVLADMPMVDPAHLRRLADCETNAATRYPDSRAGVPVCIRGEAVGKLKLLTGDRGAGAVLSGLAPLAVIEADPASLADVDTPGELARIAIHLRSS